MKERKELLIKWLQMLFYIQIASMVITAVNAVSNLDTVTTWVSKALTVVAIWSLFQLKDVNPRYRTTTVSKAVALACGLLTTPVNTSALGLSSILVLVGAAASWIASYQEYHGHGELVAEADEKLAKKWNGLFMWEILIGLGISLISTITTTLMVATGVLTGTITTLIIALSTICGLALDGLYLYYMKQTIKLIDA